MTQVEYLTAQKHRHYWEQYQAALFMRLSPEAVHDLQTILVAHGRPNTNWWCADCVKSALSYIYEQADLFAEANQHQVSHALTNTETPRTEG
jgi:hypothetical protein